MFRVGRAAGPGEKKGGSSGEIGKVRAAKQEGRGGCGLLDGQD
jgi:hypothetical protein